MKKTAMMFVLLLLFSSFVIAQEIADPFEETETCTGFFGKVKCVLFGDPARRALVGEASTKNIPDGATHTIKSDKETVYLREYRGKVQYYDSGWKDTEDTAYNIKEYEAILKETNAEFTLSPLQPAPSTTTPASSSSTTSTFADADDLFNTLLNGASTPQKTAAPTAAGTTPAPAEKLTPLSNDQQNKLKGLLGETIFRQYLGENGEFLSQYKKIREGVIQKTDGPETVTIRTSELKEGFRTVSVTTKDAKGAAQFSVLNLNDQEIARQEKAGEINVADQTIPLPKGKTLDSLKTEALFFGKTDEKEGGSVTIDAKTGKVAVYNYDEGTRSFEDTKTGEKEQTSGSYYKKGDSGCKETGGCYIADGGTLQVPIDIDGDGAKEIVPYSVDYDYDGFGGEQKLSQIQFYDQRGNNVGVQQGDTRILAHKTDQGYVYELKKGDRVIKVERTSLGGVKPVNLEDETDSLFINNVEALKDIASRTEGGLATAQQVFESIYAITSSTRQFPALSKLIFGETDFYKEHTAWADRTFAPLLGTNWFPSWCETDARWAKIEPEGKAVIKTVSGTYQAVASIQMERSETRTPILCHKNPDEEADERFICNRGQVCVDESFCWKDQNRDGKPDRDEEKPLEGYFYKITWAVSSPQDEALTPFVDENGVAVSFNIVLNPVAAPFGIKTPQSIPLYNREGNTISPIELRNGESDKDHIIKYSPNVYQEACIVWDKAPNTFKGRVSGSVSIPNICFQAVTSSVGTVNWERSGQGGTSVSANKGDISRNTDW